MVVGKLEKLEKTMADVISLMQTPWEFLYAKKKKKAPRDYDGIINSIQPREETV
jgi:hypothetical protein